MDRDGIREAIAYINKTKGMERVGFAVKVRRKIYLKELARHAQKNGSFFPVASADISEDICLPHGLVGIFVSQGAHIGAGCTVFQQVTIGSNTLADTKCPGSPWIGDNVYIGAGAKIVGGGPRRRQRSHRRERRGDLRRAGQRDRRAGEAAGHPSRGGALEPVHAI